MPTDAGTDRTAPPVWARPSLAAAALAIALAVAGHARGHELSLPAEGIAAVVLNVARFTLWPDAAGDGAPDALVVCASHDCPMLRALRDLEGLAVGGRRIVVIERAQPWLAPCAIAFVSEAEGEAGRAAAEAGASVLLISDAPDFVAQGGAVGVVAAPGGVGFEVNVAAVERAGLRISSKLLRLARRIGP